MEFVDPFRRTTGIAALRLLFERWLQQYRRIGFSGFRVTGDADRFTMTYGMHMQMAVGPEFTTPMASICVAHDGRIARLDDYYDFASGLVSASPAMAGAYRAIVNRLFL